MLSFACCPSLGSVILQSFSGSLQLLFLSWFNEMVHKMNSCRYTLSSQDLIWVIYWGLKVLESDHLCKGTSGASMAQPSSSSEALSGGRCYFWPCSKGQLPQSPTRGLSQKGSFHWNLISKSVLSGSWLSPALSWTQTCSQSNHPRLGQPFLARITRPTLQ